MIKSIGLGTTYAFTTNLLLGSKEGYTRQRLVATSPDPSLGDYDVKQLGIPGTINNGQSLQGGIPAFDLTTYASLGKNQYRKPFTFVTTSTPATPILL